MAWFQRRLGVLTFLLLLASPRAAFACPFCKEAIESPARVEDLLDDTDPFREGRAYNLSIYLMVGMPYLLLGTFGYLIYRGSRQKSRADQPTAGGGPDRSHAGEGDRPCFNPSPGEGS